MFLQQPSANQISHPPKHYPHFDSLAGALVDLGITPTEIESLEEAFSNELFNQTNRVYNAMSQVDPTSLSSVESAITIYEAVSVVMNDLLDLDKEDPQLDVVRDSLAATKRRVILWEMRRTLVTGDRRLCSIGRDE